MTIRNMITLILASFMIGGLYLVGAGVWDVFKAGVATPSELILVGFSEVFFATIIYNAIK